MVRISLSLVDDNPYNPRLVYDEQDIRKLADSLAKNGLLSPVQLRKHEGRYQIVYGHRRVRAARFLGHNTIDAKLVQISDKKILEAALVENLSRKDLSDYELALSFQRFIDEFGVSPEEVGDAVGLSRSHVSNNLRMLHLFDQKTLKSDGSLNKALHSISEHHARLLFHIANEHDRIRVAKMVFEERMSVRDLSRFISGLRGWFANNRDNGQNSASNTEDSHAERQKDRITIEKAVNDLFRLPSEGNFEEFVNLHMFDKDFSSWSAFPPYARLDSSQSLDKDKHWFHSVAPSRSYKIHDLRIKFFGDVALVTFYVDAAGRHTEEYSGVRGSVLFQGKTGSWKIVHEHWSKIEGPIDESDSSKIQQVVARATNFSN